jgi:hypothetical protein
VIILVVETKLKTRVVLSEERWNHIISRHPAVMGRISEIEQTLARPDVIIFNGEAYIYQRKYETYLTIVLDKKQTFIITAFLAENIKQGETVWKN